MIALSAAARHVLSRALASSLGLAACLAPSPSPAQVIDLATLDTGGGLMRVHGSAASGLRGVPVAGGFDCDEDGAADVAMASMRANTLGRSNAGEVYLVFGDGTVSGTLDTDVVQDRILVIVGSHQRENAGSEIWMDDVTGDGVGDLLIARQNYEPDASRHGAGALTILVGGPEVREYAETGMLLDLAAPPATLTLTTFVGAAAYDRLGIWMRTGDVTGDGVADIVVGADQAGPVAALGGQHYGAAYVIRGGEHLADGGTIDLASFGSTALAGHIARVLPPQVGATSEDHFGATCQIADLDGNGRGEVLIASALNRSGAGLLPNDGSVGSAHATAGTLQGTVYIAWDDNFPEGAWTPGLSFGIPTAPGTTTILDGGPDNEFFGEEIIGGFDWDGDGTEDLFVGDITGDGSPQGNRQASGLGIVFYDAAALKGEMVDLDMPPMGLVTTRVLGTRPGALTADTAVAGDFDGDGRDDLGIASPHAAPLGRASAGAFHILHGRSGPWPAVIDLAGPLPAPEDARITEIFGALGTNGPDRGDTLGYSAAAGSIDGDSRDDLICNEMTGNGLASGTVDVGNLIVISGDLIVPEPSARALAAAVLLVMAAVRRAAVRPGLRSTRGRP